MNEGVRVLQEMGLQRIIHGPAARMISSVLIWNFLVLYLSFGVDCRIPNARINNTVFFKAETKDFFKMSFDRNFINGTVLSWEVNQGGEGCAPRDFKNMTFPIRMPCTCAYGTLILAEQVWRHQSIFWVYSIIYDLDDMRREICMQTEDPIAEEMAKIISEAPEEQVDYSFNLLYIVLAIFAVCAVPVAFGIFWKFCNPFSGARVHEGNDPGVEMREGGQRLVEPVT